MTFYSLRIFIPGTCFDACEDSLLPLVDQHGQPVQEEGKAQKMAEKIRQAITTGLPDADVLLIESSFREISSE